MKTTISLPVKTDPNYWENRYKTGETGWNLGKISPPLQAYFDQVPPSEKNKKILLPGAGFGHEAAYLWQNDFTEVILLDVSQTAFAKAKSAYAQLPEDWFVVQDFFAHKGSYDLIVEQTFFCALSPDLRPEYAKKMYNLLRPGGKLIGVFFDIHFDHPGPPFGGDRTEYEKLFSPFFQIKVMERCYNSIKARQGNELFFIFEKPAER